MLHLSVVLLAVSASLAVIVIAIAIPRLGTAGPTALFSRFAMTAAVAAFGSSAMYLFHGRGAGAVALVAGDTTMVLAPGCMSIALSALAARRARVAYVLTGSGALSVGVISAIAPDTVSLSVKAVVMALLCAAGAWTALSPPLRGTSGMTTIAVVMATYGVFSASRVVVGLAVGWESDLYTIAFSFAPTTILGAVGVSIVGAAASRRILLATRLQKTRARVTPATRMSVVLDLGAQDEMSSGRVGQLVSDLRTASHTISPAAYAVPGGSVVTLRAEQSDFADDLARTLRSNFGWSRREIGALRTESAVVDPDDADPGGPAAA